MSDAILDPKKHILVVMAKRDEVQVYDDPDGEYTSFGFSNLVDGVEIVHEGDLWWPVP